MIMDRWQYENYIEDIERKNKKQTTNKIVTNADKIRSMSDEELAEFIEDVTGSYTPCRFCNPITKEDGYCNLACDDGVLNWVKAEVIE